ncbi:SRPBCC family protein [Undibacterium sp. TJN25]|uniref:SRPBCC family protein n=1 Tax=Undibacterium sp. TJN25 TaxID=3413056 RepID=UPI003BF2468C
MEFSGTQTIAAPRDAVWAALNDPTVLQACVPGCESFSARSEDEYEAVVQAAVGPVKARFKGSLTLSERRPNEGYRIAGKGEGGVAGFGKMQAVVTLVDGAEDSTTVLTYEATADVGGKLAQVGSRLVASVANRMADEFFKRFSEQLAPLAEAQADNSTPTEGAAKKWWQRG